MNDRSEPMINFESSRKWSSLRPLLVQIGFGPATDACVDNGNNEGVSAYECVTFLLGEYKRLQGRHYDLSEACATHDSLMTNMQNTHDRLKDKVEKAENEVEDMRRKLIETVKLKDIIELQKNGEIKKQEALLNSLSATNKQLSHTVKRREKERDETKERLRKVLEKNNSGLSTMRLVNGPWNRGGIKQASMYGCEGTRASTKLTPIVYEAEKRQENQMQYLLEDNLSLRSVVRTLSESFNNLFNSAVDAQEEADEHVSKTPSSSRRDIFPMDESFFDLPSDQLQRRVAQLLTRAMESVDQMAEDEDSEDENVNTPQSKQQMAGTPTSEDVQGYKRIIAAQKAMIDQLLSFKHYLEDGEDERALLDEVTLIGPHDTDMDTCDPISIQYENVDATQCRTIGKV
eukprot:CFRG7786T1